MRARVSSASKMNTLLTTVFVYFALSSIAAIEISSKIDFGSDDVPISESPVEKSDPVVIVVENSNTETLKETRGFLSPGSRSRAGGNVSLRGPVKPIRSHANYPHNPQPTRPKMMKNIYIVVNGKGTPRPDNFLCEEGVCRATLTTDVDEEGNVIGAVCITIVTKSEDPKIDDVPIIDGIRGTGLDKVNNPPFVFSNGPIPPNPPFLDNNIPQPPFHRQGHPPRRNRFRPSSASFYPGNLAPRKETPAWSPWIPRRATVDDKIEAPFSRTNPI